LECDSTLAQGRESKRLTVDHYENLPIKNRQFQAIVGSIPGFLCDEARFHPAVEEVRPWRNRILANEGIDRWLQIELLVFGRDASGERHIIQCSTQVALSCAT